MSMQTPIRDRARGLRGPGLLPTDLATLDAKVAAAAVSATSSANSAATSQTARIAAEAARDTTRGYRDQAQLLVDGATFAVAYGDLTALAQTSLLAGLTGVADGDIARVVNTRDGGWWKWHSGDLSAQVAGDPFGGLWRPLASNPSGTLGAWQRMVEKSIYDAEWWLPELMPTGAQNQINAAILATPDPYAQFLLPRREVLATGSVLLTKGFDYRGAGKGCRINGQGGRFQVVVITANNAKLHNISAGNVSNGLPVGEAGGFHIFDGDQGQLGLVTTPIENVSAYDCHAFDAEMGFRAGVNGSYFDYPSGGPTYPTRDTYLENFTCDGIRRIGIETMQAHGVQVVGGTVRMSVPPDISGFDRGMRIVGAHDVAVIGTRFISPDTTTARGVSIEYGGSSPTSRTGSKRIVCEGVRVEDATQCFVIDPKSQDVLITGCLGTGRRDTYSNTFLGINTRSTGVTNEDAAAKSITVRGNKASNLARFMGHAAGWIYDLVVDGNHFTSNAHPQASFMEIAQGTDHRMVGAEVTRNRGIINPASSYSAIRFITTNAESDLTLDDNKFTPGTAGIMNITGAATIKMRSADSNKELPNALWAASRPDMPKEVYN